MRVLVTGASGNIASAVLPELLAAGHAVVGLVRSERAAQIVASRGAEARSGDLDDLDALRTAAEDADGVVHLAFQHERQNAGDLAGAIDGDLQAVAAIGDALKGTGKPFVGTGATMALVLAGHQGRLSEDDTLPGGPRVDAENAVVALAEQGVRSSVVRLPNVHGDGNLGFADGLIAIARATGVSGYLGDGKNRWSAAHTRDVGRLYRLALESAPPGTRLHAVAEHGIPFRDLAAVIGRHLGVPAAPVDPAAAHDHFGHLSMFVGLDNPTASETTRHLLGWEPGHPGLLADVDNDRHFAGDHGGAQ